MIQFRDRHYKGQHDVIGSLNRFCTSPAASHPDLSANAYRKHPTIVYEYIDDVIVAYDESKTSSEPPLSTFNQIESPSFDWCSFGNADPSIGFAQLPYRMNASFWIALGQKARAAFLTYEHWLYASTCCVGGALGDTQ